MWVVSEYPSSFQTNTRTKVQPKPGLFILIDVFVLFAYLSMCVRLHVVSLLSTVKRIQFRVCVPPNTELKLRI